MLAKRVLRLVVERPVLLRAERVVGRRAVGAALAQQVLSRGITTPSLANFSSSAVAEHVANLPDPSEAFDRIVHRSPHDDIEIPNHTIWEVAEHQARCNGDKTAFVCGITHEKVTFRELFAGARRLAASFVQQGVRKGDVVVLHSFNCIEYPMVVLGEQTALAYQLTQSKASFLVTHKQLENVAVKAAEMAGLTNAVTFTMGTTDAAETHDLKSINAGRLVPNTELRVRCMSTDRDLPPNHEGELLYRGPQVMLGYENNHEANQSIFTEDGFLRTGDIGYIDDDGFVFVIDRAKELIKYKGHQVAPGELEDVLNHHPAIADCCCVRGQNAQGEEIPKAFVVLKNPESPHRPTPQDIMDYVAEHVAPFKKVREVQFIESIPKNASGKMLRRRLQERENRMHNA
ncbi:unnamed protein product [Phytophthora lilii]|uniref:Unnamed protein product n=1 Tax=Phytophthora lilii TaxID=2077276 RepID=A0A9W6WPT7_9STRA|nr:unnamed protein product [Phytophthora lilii]